MTTLDLALVALAVWRVAHMIAREDGPFDVFHRWHLHVGAVKTAAGFWTADRSWPKFWICPLCQSVWLAVLFLALYGAHPWLTWTLTALAVSGAASALELLTEH